MIMINLNINIMRNFLFICLFFSGIVMITESCSGSGPAQTNVSSEESTAKEDTSESTNTNATTDVDDIEQEEDVVENATKRDKLFYQRLLEYFCYHHYTECFGSKYSPRIYKENSLVVNGEPTVIDCNMDGDRIVSYNMKVSGINSWEGHINTPHNEWPFEATIHELGDDSYRITFTTPEVKRWPMNRTSEEILTATRTIEYIDQK
jgi:hypothetical protein